MVTEGVVCPPTVRVNGPLLPVATSAGSTTSPAAVPGQLWLATDGNARGNFTRGSGCVPGETFLYRSRIQIYLLEPS